MFLQLQRLTFGPYSPDSQFGYNSRSAADSVPEELA